MASDIFNDSIQINVHDTTLVGDLMIPENAKGLVVFAHGSDSRRLGKTNRFVAEHLHRFGFATLLFDLLTEEEEEEFKNTRDIPKLAQRLIDTVYWIQKDDATKDYNIGFLGFDTGTAAALGAAAALGEIADAVVGVGGRPDLSDTVLADVHSPVLFIVGGKDEKVLEMNIQAQNQLLGIKDVEIVPDATHLFEEPGALEMAAQLATDWFRKYLGPNKQQPLSQDKP
ncbi:dienelactone hydrolase family protein [Pontibacter silvestris]|uniref:Dienelactone hydrolase family protein n=1 Tax=Pontibacter silvestris TaxID=2305183 RepID=A0ABW4WXB2_9BACT|nr:dienelactone hydrolase family protein [Pontibacter silvestris]MCC9136793.1 dienelactone hydrolase family protein [Pontibacter silvestris]